MKKNQNVCIGILALLLLSVGCIIGITHTTPVFATDATTEATIEATTTAETTATGDAAHIPASGDANIDGSIGHMNPAATETNPSTETRVVTDAAGNTSTEADGEPVTEVIDNYPSSVTDPGAPAITAHSAVIIDAKTGYVLYGKNEYERHYPASITKVMTALLALENTNLNDTITFSHDAIWGIERDSNHIALDEGEQISAEECLYGILLCSANEASWGMAEHVSGSLDAFAQEMNTKAQELGCYDTHFVNANGLHDSQHYTTAYDMALITRAAIQIPMFRTIDETQYYQIPPTNMQEEPRDLWHQLKMIYPSSPYYCDYVEGGKTGFTDQARNTLVTYAKQGDMELICVMMDCRGARNAYVDSKALYEYYFTNYTYAYPLRNFNPNSSDQTNLLLRNFYRGLDHDSLNLSVDNSMPVIVPKNYDETALVTQTTYYTDIRDNTVGAVSVSYNGTKIGESAIRYSNMTINGETLSWGPSPEETQTKGRVLHIILLTLAGLAVAFLVFLLVASKIVKKRRRRARHTQSRSRDLRF